MSLKQKMDLINNTFGGQILAIYIIIIAFYCQLPDLLMGRLKKNLIRVTIYLSCNVLTWIIAAEFHSFVISSKILLGTFQLIFL